MFVHQHQLRHVLRPDQYYSEEQHGLELDRFFLPGWHPVGTADDFRRHGDFIALDLLGYPVQVRNMDGEIHAFLNVCAHRHALLTHAPRGCDPRLRCQYHGWEYNAEGRTGRIPDAQAFRPFDRENARLRKLRVDRCGDIVFVSLAEDGPDLREALGPAYDEWSLAFAPPFRPVVAWERDYPANWKVPVENSLESYHIPCVHPKTFGEFPPETNCGHDLTPLATRFRTRVPDDLPNRFARFAARRLGLPITDEYTHQHVHPHLTYSSLDTFRMIQAVLPTSPTTCRHRAWGFSAYGPRTGPLARVLAFVMGRASAMVARQVLAEDAAIFEAVQRGLRASPHAGVVGTREERIYVFQNYIADGCAGMRPAQPSAMR